MRQTSLSETERPMTPAQSNSYSVCCLARESLPTVQRFVDHYRHGGADRIFLFLDGTDDETQEVSDAFQGDDFVSITRCNPEFWRNMYPDGIDMNLSDKIVGVFELGIHKNKSDWVLFCDADEFVVGDRPLGVALAMLPTDFRGVRIQNTEAVWGVEDDISKPYSCGFERAPFKGSLGRKEFLARLVYGRNWKFMRRGTAGHVAGKHLLRKGVIPDEITSHLSIVDGKKVRFMPVGLRRSMNLRLVHFDAISHQRWREKWQSRLREYSNFEDLGKPRQLQLEMVKSALKDGTDHQLFRRYYGLNHWQKFMLRRLGLLTSIKK